MKRRHKQRGISTVHWLVALIPILGVGAFSIDLNNVFIAHTELQAAADAGALEGARNLYCANNAEKLNHIANHCGSGIPSANEAAIAAAQANFSRGSPVEVVAAERGHWEFKSPPLPILNGIERGGEFTANEDVTEPGSLFDGGNYRPFIDLNIAEDLNRDKDEINAFRVIVARNTTIPAILGNLLGIDNFSAQATSVAYIGFAGSLGPGDVDLPLAMCEDRFKDETGAFNCTVGRLSTSSANDLQTSQWTDLTQEVSCSAASNQGVEGRLDQVQCEGGLDDAAFNLRTGDTVNISNGTVDNNFEKLYCHWRNCAPKGADGCPNEPWKVKAPRVNCSGLTGGQCKPVRGALEVEMLWVNYKNPGNYKNYCKDYDIDLTAACEYPSQMKNIAGADEEVTSWSATDSSNTGRPLYDVNGNCWDDDYNAAEIPATPFGGDCQGHSIVDANTIPLYVYDSGSVVKLYDTTGGQVYTRKMQLWDSFVKTFNIQSDQGDVIGWHKLKDITSGSYNDSGYRPLTTYLSPNCEAVKIGGTGGENFGVRAEEPVLVF